MKRTRVTMMTVMVTTVTMMTTVTMTKTNPVTQPMCLNRVRSLSLNRQRLSVQVCAQIVSMFVYAGLMFASVTVLLCCCVAVVLFVLVASGRHDVAVVAGGASTPKKKQKSQPEGEFAYGTTRETIEIDMEDWERFKGFPYYHDVYSLECTDVTFV